MIKHYIEACNSNDAFIKSALLILSYGHKIAPRNLSTYEISPLTIKIENPRDCVISLKERKHPYIFNIMELFWILSGDIDPWIIRFLPKLEEYTDIKHNRKVLSGAYGPRIRNYFGIDQLYYVVDKLRNDRNSRQAIINIWNPAIDTNPNKDIPCTINFVFTIRNDKLNMTTFMRSNDLFLGACSDWFNFCVIQCLIADILKIEVGEYFHITNSMHIYEKDLEKINKIIGSYELIDVDCLKPDGILGYNTIEEIDNDVRLARNYALYYLPPLSNFKYLSKLLMWVHNKRSKLLKE